MAKCEKVPIEREMEGKGKGYFLSRRLTFSRKTYLCTVAPAFDLEKGNLSIGWHLACSEGRQIEINSAHKKECCCCDPFIQLIFGASNFLSTT